MSLRIAILCNDTLALPALNALLAAGLVKAVAMPKRTTETQQVVHHLCTTHKVPLLYFSRSNFENELPQWLATHQPDIVLVKTFPYKIPASLLSIPVHGFINFHYAPLPMWRGPHPLFWMIRYRVPMAGITIHRMDEQFDTGPVLYHMPVPVPPESTLGMLKTQLAMAGIQATNYILHAISTKTVTETPQENVQAGWHTRPTAADVTIDWYFMGAAEIQALVRACNPWNKGAATMINNWMFAITEATLIPIEETKAGFIAPGTIVQMDPVNGMQIMCCDGQLLRADVVYCQEGFFPGYRLADFGVKKNNTLGSHIPSTEHSKPILK